jgi:hypothetical protein
LKDTHPIVAPAYTDRRSALAKQFGLGRSDRANTGAPAALDPTFAASLSAPKRRKATAPPQ